MKLILYLQAMSYEAVQNLMPDAKMAFRTEANATSENRYLVHANVSFGLL